MTIFDITMADGSTERVLDADAYDMEGPLTTFFTSDTATEKLDAWSVRLASFRSADIVKIRRVCDSLDGSSEHQPPQLTLLG